MPPPVLLCIDDRAQLLHVRKANLERLGFAVVTATSVPTALAVLEQTDVAAVLLDYKLEGLDAEAVAFYVKQRFPKKPVLLLSAYSDMPEGILWLVDEYIMKSEPLERLAEAVERVTRCGNSPKHEAAA
jgi:DNA-binding NtrC family response regulator